MREQMSGKQKAAAFMISLGPDISSRVFKHLSEEEIEALTLEIASMQKVSPEDRDKIREEFHELAVAQNYISQGGINYARELLEKALGLTKAMEVIERLTSSLQVRPFDFIRRSDPTQVLSFVQNEHPQTIALILAYLQPKQASLILSALPPEIQVDVAKRIAIMDRTSPDIVQQVEKVLERKLANSWGQESSTAGGIEAAVVILNQVDRSTEKTILESLEINEPALAEEIKKRMFVFEDIVLLDDRSVQRILREVDMGKDMPLALKAVSDEVREKIMHNISKNAAQNLQENIEYLGPVRLRDVEEAQQRIVNIIRHLEEEGEIVISRGEGKTLWSSRVIIKAEVLQVEGVRRIRGAAGGSVVEASLQGVARGEAVALLEAARAEAEAILAEARRLGQEERQAAFLQGYQEGYAAGKKETEDFLGQARELWEAAARERESWYAGVQGEIFELVTAIAGKVIAGELTTRPEALVDLVSAAVRELGEAKRVTVSLAPTAARKLVKHEHRLRSRFPALDSLEIREDASLGEGCLVESGDALVDATVDGQLGTIRTALLDAIPNGALPGEGF